MQNIREHLRHSSSMNCRVRRYFLDYKSGVDVSVYADPRYTFKTDGTDKNQA